MVGFDPGMTLIMGFFGPWPPIFLLVSDFQLFKNIFPALEAGPGTESIGRNNGPMQPSDLKTSL